MPRKKPNGHPEPDLVEIPEVAPETLELTAETLTGDIRDFILDRLKFEQSKRPWHERSESDQRDTVHAVESAVSEMVRQAVELIAGAGLKTIKATLDKVEIKDGIKATLTMSKFDPHRHALGDAQGKTVLVVVADADEFTGERAPVEIAPDQGDLERVGVQHSDADDNHAGPFH